MIAPVKAELQLAMLAKNSTALMDFDVRFSSHADRGTEEDNAQITTNTMSLTAPADKADLISAQCVDLDLTALGFSAPTTRKMTIVPIRNLTPAQRSNKRLEMKQQNVYLSGRHFIFLLVPVECKLYETDAENIKYLSRLADDALLYSELGFLVPLFAGYSNGLGKPN